MDVYGAVTSRRAVGGFTDTPVPRVVLERVAHGDPWDERQYEMYPPALKSPYAERRSTFGKERYSALGIAREDWEARQRAAIANWNCFGAPAALFCYIDRDLGRPQWADVGMYLQTVMRLLRAAGLHSCPQMHPTSHFTDSKSGAHPEIQGVRFQEGCCYRTTAAQRESLSDWPD